MEAKLDLSAIDPRNGSKYSPNLLKWLRKRRWWKGEDARVYRADDNRLYIGVFDREGFFSGSNLQAVLCRGRQCESGCYGRIDIKEVVDFWERYVAIGRCAIDTDHRQHFVGDETRWLVEGNRRSCQWCGNCVQELREREEIVVRREWHNLAPGVTA